MRRCIELASKNVGYTYPNPLVGSVIVHDNKIIGEGSHAKYGESHAEVNAINSVKDKRLLKNSTLYVNLEPCNHHGKTPPCTEAIINNNIKKVVIGSQDPNKLVNGSGIEKLRSSGCNVSVGIMDKECDKLNKRFFTYHKLKRPFIILKWAETKDGFISPTKSVNTLKKVNWITGEDAKKLSHKWRSEEHSILVGVQTIIDEAYINYFSIKQKYRQKGYGGYLMSYLIKQCEKLNIKRILLEVSDKNSIAEIFYNKFSFLTVGRRKNNYKDGSDAVLKEKFLKIKF